MTNDNLKRAIRAYKQTYEVNHTTARRIVMAASRGRGASRIEPPVELRLLRGHPWADLILDGRSAFRADKRLTGSLGTPLSEATLDGPTGGEVRVAVRAYRPPEWKGSVVTTITYPDGFTLARVSAHLADYFCSAAVINAYRIHGDVFRDLLFYADPRVQHVTRAGCAARFRGCDMDTGPRAREQRLVRHRRSRRGHLDQLGRGNPVDWSRGGFGSAAAADEVFDWAPAHVRA